MSPFPPPTETPEPLPPHLILDQLASRARVALLLDYDGTISDTTPDLHHARPRAGAREALAALTKDRNRVEAAVVSGRDIDQLQQLLGVVSGLYYVGSHGLEILDPDGRRWMVHDVETFMPAIEDVRKWLAANVPPDCGFVIERKPFSAALHFRKADPKMSAPVCANFERFLAQQPTLQLLRGKMVLEAMPLVAGKGGGVRHLLSRLEGSPLPVYFGDDSSDEDAFYALRTDGVTVLVDPDSGPSWAKYRVPNPAAVLRCLEELAAALHRPP